MNPQSQRMAWDGRDLTVPTGLPWALINGCISDEYRWQSIFYVVQKIKRGDQL